MLEAPFYRMETGMDLAQHPPGGKT